MATVETILSEAIPEQLSPGVLRQDQKADPFFAQIARTSKGVTKMGVASTGWMFQRACSLGLGGYVQHVGVLGPTVSTRTGPLLMYTDQSKYPDPMLATIPGQDRMQGALSQVRGNIVLDEAYLRESMAPGIILDTYKELMNSVALRITLAKLASFYTPSSATRHVCTVSGWVATAAGASGNFVPAEGNEVLFHEGHLVQFYGVTGAFVGSRHSASGAQTDDLTVKIMVTAVDPIERRVYVQDLASATSMATSGNVVQDGDIVVFLGQLTGGAGASQNVQTGTPVPYGAYGLVDWLVNTGSILGIDTAKFQRLKSFKKSNLGGPWTEEEADKLLMWYNRWHSNPITSLFMTPGAALAHKKSTLGMFTADRTGKPVKIVGGSMGASDGGHTGMIHVHDGRDVTYWSTPYMRAGYIVGVYNEGNFEELHPPRDPSAGGNGGFGNEVEFKVREAGAFRSIFRIVSYTDGNAGVVVATTHREAPFCMWYQRWPMKHLPGIMIGGVTEANWAP